MILILRTFSHSKNWDKDTNLCVYDYKSYSMLKEWEPDIVENIENVSSAIGIYIPKYYSYSTYKGRVFMQTPEEEHPSLIKPIRISTFNNRQVYDDGKTLNIPYVLESKINVINRRQMHEIDNLLVQEKIRTSRIKTLNHGYSSLCFTLRKDFVRGVFAKYNFQIPDDGYCRKPVF